MEFDYKFKEAVLKIGDNAKYVLPSSVFIMKNKNRKKESEIRIVTVRERELRNVMTSYYTFIVLYCFNFFCVLQSRW